MKIKVNEIRDRIKQFRRVPASSIYRNPLNFRRHTGAQKNAMRAVLREIGFAGAVLVRERDDGVLELIDGELRSDEVGDKKIPALVTDLSEDEAKKLLAVYDPISAMAEADKETLEKLSNSVQFAEADLAKLVRDTLNASGDIDDIAADENKKNNAGPEIPEMELKPDEHYDCVMVLATNRQDWNRLVALLGLRQERKSRGARIGLNRAVHAAQLLALIEDGSLQDRRSKSGTA